MRVLVACEFSGTVRDAFRALGHDAVSSDLLPTETPGPHHQGDVREMTGPYVGGPGLTDPQRAMLLTTCGCGHTLEDHGSLTPCWRCEENGDACTSDFESLLVERIGWLLNRTEATS